MTVAEFLSELRALDAHVTLNGDKLHVNARPGVLTPAHLEELRRRKAEILEFLQVAARLGSQQRAIVPLQAEGGAIPVFGVAGHNGDVFCYRALAEELGAGQPFFGLQPPGIDAGTSALTQATDLAGYFAAQIREFRPHQPCVIAGFCAGGTIAFELARQLIAAGSRVTSLVLFGAPFSTSYRTVPQLIANTAYFARRSVVHARTLLTLPTEERRRYLAERARALNTPNPQAPADPVLIRRGLVEEATMEAVRKYEPGAFGGHVDLMIPCESWKHSADAPLRWARFATSSAEFVGPDDCDGDTMLLPQHAATFARLFKLARERRAATNPE